MASRKLSESEKKIIAYSQEWKCGHCKDILPSSYQIDHIIPHSISGNDDRNNLVALCPTCHSNKTQKENNRICKFKKIRSQIKKDICWFCLKENIHNHTCQKILEPIITPNATQPINKTFDNFIFSPLEKSFQKLNLDTTLHIRITPFFVYINNFFTPSDELTIDTIAQAVFIATRTKKESNKYTEVEIIIDLGEDTPDELIDFINTNLHPKLTKRIFKPNSEIEYTFIVE